MLDLSAGRRMGKYDDPDDAIPTSTSKHLHLALITFPKDSSTLSQLVLR
jgi:hypothetical protein